MKGHRAAYGLVAIVSLLVAVGVWYAVRGRDSGKVNVVLISIDTLRADHLGCYGYPFKSSPNIDKLAAEGVRFANAFSQSSWTLPSHMSIMTSQYPSTHRVGPSRRALADSTATLAQLLSQKGYETAGFVSWVYLGRQWGFARGFDRYVELWGPAASPNNPAGGAPSARIVTDFALRWIGGEHKKPFFLFVHYFDPHMNYSPPAPLDSMFDPDYRGPARGEWSWLGPYIKWMNKDPKAIDERDLAHVVALYDGEIRYVDQQVQRLFDGLRESANLDNSLIIVTSDHGEEFNDHGSMEGHGWTLYDEILRVPLIMRRPGRLRGGEVIDSDAALIDIAPTILGFLRIPVPRGFQGRSLDDAIYGTASGREKRFAFAETYRFNCKRSIRGSRYKLIHTEDTGTGKGGVRWAEAWELFDILKDIKEQHDLFDENLAIGGVLADRLKQFKLSSRAERSVGVRAGISDEDLELLRSLGYVE